MTRGGSSLEEGGQFRWAWTEEEGYLRVEHTLIANGRDKQNPVHRAGPMGLQITS